MDSLGLKRPQFLKTIGAWGIVASYPKDIQILFEAIVDKLITGNAHAAEENDMRMLLMLSM